MENSVKTILYCAEKKDMGLFLLQPLYEETADELLIKESEYDVDIRDSDIVAVSFDEEGTVTSITVDKEKTEERKTEMKKKLSSLFDN